MAERLGWSDSLRDKVDTLKRAVDLRELFQERYPGRFRRSGKWLYGSSPYRQDRKPSFAVNEDVFIDFATGERGDEVDFIMREQGVNFQQAVEMLEARAGGAPLAPKIRPVIDPSASPNEPPPAVWQEIMLAECQRAHTALFSNTADAKAALKWLHARGLKNQTIYQAGLGFNPLWLQTRLKERESGRAISIAPGVLIPCQVDSALWSVHVRTLRVDDSTKYLYVRGSKTGGLYNGNAVTAGCTVLIVEGEFDALLAQQELGKQAVVVTIGSAANRLPLRWLERLRAAHRVYSCMDQDEAGQRAAVHLSEQLGEKHAALRLPAGKDITEFVVNHGGSLLNWWRLQITEHEPRPVQLSLPS
ncbi:MAG: toprim domain-containing protein [Anaerolineae bacterium]